MEPNGQIIKSEDILSQDLEEVTDPPLITEEVPFDYTEDRRGAVIRLNNTLYVEITGNLLIAYEFRRERWIKKAPIPVLEFDYNFPPNINSVLESINGYIYFIRKDDYCKRKISAKYKVFSVNFSIILFNDQSYQCKRWKPLKVLLGCDSKQNLMGLCDDVTIDSIITIKEQIFVFRENKFWTFSSSKERDRPFGPIIEGNVDISQKWKGFKPENSRFTVHNNKIVAISGQEWTEIEINGKVVKSQEILPQKLV